MSEDPFVDMTFGVTGYQIPVDHGYPLFSAVSRILPLLHRERANSQHSIGIHPIRGKLEPNRLLTLTPRSRLVIRLPESRIAASLVLNGQRLEVHGHHIEIGAGFPMPLKPAATLHSRLVIIKGATDEAAFHQAAKRQLESLQIAAQPHFVPRTSDESRHGKWRRQDHAGRAAVIRRTTRIKDREIVGFALLVEGLTAEESIRLQERGIGGRRHFGCGIFVPVR